MGISRKDHLSRNHVFLLSDRSLIKYLALRSMQNLADLESETLTTLY